MLCSQNSGKYVSGKWHEGVCLVSHEVDNFTPFDLDFYESTNYVSGIIGKLDQFDRDMQMKTIPVDKYDDPEDYDWRCNPEVGR